MYSDKVLLIILFSAAKCTVTDSYEVVSRTDCRANRVYKKDDITCICTSDGRWPHHQCSLVFATIHQTSCEPDTLVKIGCNICRCSKTGYIDEEFCTHHICDKDRRMRRNALSENSKCEPNHWYYISNCRICYCINKNNLLCSSGVSNPRKLLLGKNDLMDCGLNFLNEINALFSANNPQTSSKTEEQDNTVVSETKAVPKGTVKKDLSVFFNAMNEERELSVQDNDNSGQDNSNVSNEDNFNEGQDTIKSKQVLRIPAYTAMPAGNYDEEFEDDNSSEVDSGKNDLNIDIEADNNQKGVGSVEADDSKLHNIIRTQKEVSNDALEDKSFLKVNIPGFFEKTFVFRKSMVSLDNANCVPGSTVTVVCNTCFCLKNGKMLCTKKICK